MKLDVNLEDFVKWIIDGNADPVDEGGAWTFEINQPAKQITPGKLKWMVDDTGDCLTTNSLYTYYKKQV